MTTEWSGSRCRIRRLAGEGSGLEARIPESAHRATLFTRTIIQLAEHVGRGPRVRGQIGAKPRQDIGLFEDPRELVAGCRWNPMQHHSPPEIEPRGDTRDVDGCPCPKLLAEQRHNVSRVNATRRELVAIARFGQKRLAAKPFGGGLDRLFERLVLERVQRVVVDENADGALCRQQVRQLLDHACERRGRLG